MARKQIDLSPERVAAAIGRMRRAWKLTSHSRDDGKIAWIVLGKHGGGHGVIGTEADGKAEYEKQIMFRALEALDRGHDWHEYDWHTLTGSAEERVAQILAWRADWERARASYEPFHALVNAVIRSAHRACA